MQNPLGGVELTKIGAAKYQVENLFLKLDNDCSFCILSELAEICGIDEFALLRKYAHLAPHNGALTVIYTDMAGVLIFEESKNIEVLIVELTNSIIQAEECFVPEQFARYVENVHFSLGTLDDEIELMVTINEAMDALKSDRTYKKRLDRPQAWEGWEFISKLQDALNIECSMEIMRDPQTTLWEIEIYANN